MRRLFTRRGLGPALLAAVCVGCAIPALSLDSTKSARPTSEVEQCRRIKDEQARMRCYHPENSSKVPEGVSTQQPATSGAWQLARAPNPAGGPDSISITRIINTTPSAQDIAGLMLRCGEGATTEVLVVLTKPLPLRTHPKVTVVAGATITEFVASVVTPGALVLLPEKASALVEHAWQSVPELAVSVAENQRPLHGAIPLADIGTAMRTLQSNCASAARSLPVPHTVDPHTPH